MTKRAQLKRQAETIATLQTALRRAVEILTDSRLFDISGDLEERVGAARADELGADWIRQRDEWLP